MDDLTFLGNVVAGTAGALAHEVRRHQRANFENEHNRRVLGWISGAWIAVGVGFGVAMGSADVFAPLTFLAACGLPELTDLAITKSAEIVALIVGWKPAAPAGADSQADAIPLPSATDIDEDEPEEEPAGETGRFEERWILVRPRGAPAKEPRLSWLTILASS